MFKHQLGTMYLRYFMWNFSGRASDIQDANWVGLSNAFKELPTELANNKGRNIYFGLPLLLGVIGLLYQYKKNEKYFWVTLLLFFLTGAAFGTLSKFASYRTEGKRLYLCGFVLRLCYLDRIWSTFVYDLLNKVIKNKKLVATGASFLCLSVPILMATEIGMIMTDLIAISQSMQQNYLDSCALMPYCSPEEITIPSPYGLLRSLRASNRCTCDRFELFQHRLVHRTNDARRI